MPKKANAWQALLKEHKKKYPDKPYKQVLIDCKAIYRKKSTKK